MHEKMVNMTNHQGNEKPQFTHRRAKIKRLTIPSVVKGVEQIEEQVELTETAVDNRKWCKLFENLLGIF